MPSREVANYRRDAERAFRLAGTRLLRRRAYNILDYNEGTVERCSRCWSDGYSQPTDLRCPVCYGRGFEPAYSEVEEFWGYINPDFDSEMTAGKEGTDHEYTNSLTAGYPPMLQTDDLIAELMESGTRNVAVVYSIDGKVQRSGITGVLSGNEDNVTSVDERCVGQKAARLTILYPDDLRAQQEFWDEP